MKKRTQAQLTYDQLADTLSEVNKKKKVTVRQSEMMVDFETGEEKKRTLTQRWLVDKEPDFIKIYTTTMLAFNGLDTTLAPYLIAFCKHMTYANNKVSSFRCTVRTDKFVRADLKEQFQISDRQLTNIIKKLVDAYIFIPLEINGKTQRGIYFVNPWVVAKGDWSDIKELRSTLEFTSSKSASVIIDESGQQKILLPKNISDDEKQLSLLEDQE